MPFGQGLIEDRQQPINILQLVLGADMDRSASFAFVHQNKGGPSSLAKVTAGDCGWLLYPRFMCGGRLSEGELGFVVVDTLLKVMVS